jgi:FtsH-binding integral membrane protein
MSAVRRAGLVLWLGLWLGLGLWILWCAAAWAQDLPMPRNDATSGRELFLAAAIMAMMLCCIISFAMSGRVSERTHVALAMLGVLIGSFALLVLFGGLIYEHPVAAVAGLLLLVAMFKLMSQFESQKRVDRK